LPIRKPSRYLPERNEDESPDDCPSAIAYLTEATGRRRVLRGLLLSAVGVAFAPFLVASRSAGAEERRFAETYRGRRIVGVRYDDGPSRDDGSGAWHVTVDGRRLHLMRRADGSWMSMVDHYCSYPTPLAAARAAVDELGTARLGAPDDRDSPMEGSRTPSGDERGEGGHHSGVHA
jgi:hypothetical protein